MQWFSRGVSKNKKKARHLAGLLFCNHAAYYGITAVYTLEGELSAPDASTLVTS